MFKPVNIAGTATVTRAISERLNDGAADGDRVSGKQLQDRVRYNDGSDKIGKSEIKKNAPPPEPKPDPKSEPKEQAPVTWAMDFAAVAISQLKLADASVIGHLPITKPIPIILLDIFIKN